MHEMKGVRLLLCIIRDVGTFPYEAQDWKTLPMIKAANGVGKSLSGRRRNDQSSSIKVVARAKVASNNTPHPYVICSTVVSTTPIQGLNSAIELNTSIKVSHL